MTGLINDRVDHQLEDFNINSQALAAAAQDSLMAMANNRRRQAERVASVITNLQEQLAASQRQLAEEKRVSAELRSENGALLRSRQSMSENHRRLHLCFVNLLKEVEEHCGGAVSVEQRIEATIQAVDHAPADGGGLDVISKRMTNFLETAFGIEPSKSTPFQAI